MADDAPKVLVTGATGYVGGRLASRLLREGAGIRCLVRDPDRVDNSRWPGAEIVAGDVLKRDSLYDGLSGIETAYYLVHSMAAGEHGFAERDTIAARNFGDVARECGVRNIIYLGGLGQTDSDLSQHLASRHHTGEVLRESGVPVTELRAAVVVGSGSISFETIRYLTERLPIMIAPRWVHTRCQPIAIRDVLSYLVAASQNDDARGRIIEIGGTDVLTYGEMLLGYARVRGLRRHIINVPVLTPRLSSLWVDLVTPIPASFARPLIEGLRNEVIVHDPAARSLFPDIEPLGYDDAVRNALKRVGDNAVETVWSGSMSSAFDRAPKPVVVESTEGLIFERRERETPVAAKDVFTVISRLGGRHGWLYANALWRLRAFLDRLVGGVGMRRGRRHPIELQRGDAVDFWRVEDVTPPHHLRLGAEMKLPGRAWLDFRVDDLPETGSRLTVTAIFEPRGLFGFLYWYSLYPIHRLIFSGLIRKVVERV